MYQNDSSEEMGSVKTTFTITSRHLEMCQGLRKCLKENRDFVSQKMAPEKDRKSSSTVTI